MTRKQENQLEELFPEAWVISATPTIKLPLLLPILTDAVQAAVAIIRRIYLHLIPICGIAQLHSKSTMEP